LVREAQGSANAAGIGDDAQKSERIDRELLLKRLDTLFVWPQDEVLEATEFLKTSGKRLVNCWVQKR
jgi:hypothetical protein